ncbi:1-acyl-sn-glycerol-3-phosphate acyltransferase [Halobacteriovorax sp. HLS]|uniref:1-acyl-sn-glycerol-3-phosphate acyltransferase n=1 Tax=Halobacteriovorax sp. HLS TaxID=2234000 RepID=UPI000FD6F052|nr:1-acyl-sn-glycerol-3-phosphate acyltransferase [Halobacteriovorax sp. HLS]
MSLFNSQEKIVLSYPKLKERIENREDSKAEKQKALMNLREIRAEFSKTYINSFQKLLDNAIPKLYDSVNFNENGVDFRQLVKDTSVVLVPNHQSHADYVAINYMVYKKYGFPLYVAGGNNLNIFPIGKLFRKSGCFFIRRSFANDILYKLTLEAYLYYLLMEQKPIEFFFEGGRSRTGKLLSPKYGLYQMLLEAHSHLPQAKKKDLMFVPVSIVHEYVPEQKSLASELHGAKKKKESSGQLLSLFKLFSYQFGSVHINLGNPIKALKSDEESLKGDVQNLAFECFRSVGANMCVTPSSVLGLVLLDEPGGALEWSDIMGKAKVLIDFCEKFGIPYTDSMKGDELEDSLGRALDIMIGNKKIDVIGRSTRSHTFYTIKEDKRQELLYFKNTILHHFLIPWVINYAWINLFSGKIEDVSDLKKLFIDHRKLLKHEFYLPTVKDFLEKTFFMISTIIKRDIKNLEECLELSHKELYLIASSLSVFSRSFNYIIEAYYTSAVALKNLNAQFPEVGFKNDDYVKAFKATHLEEAKLAIVVKFPESNSEPLTKSSFKYFQHEGIVENNAGSIKVVNLDMLNENILNFENLLLELRKFNLRASV